MSIIAALFAKTASDLLLNIHCCVPNKCVPDKTLKSTVNSVSLIVWAQDITFYIHIVEESIKVINLNCKRQPLTTTMSACDNILIVALCVCREGFYSAQEMT